MNDLSYRQPGAGQDGPRTGAPARPGYFSAGSGTPLVMLHSSLASKSQWAGLVELLARRFHVIAIDLCGYGDNPMAAWPSFSLDDEVRLVLGRLNQVVQPGTPIHVLGHSYGGLVALRLAQWLGQRAASISLYEPVVFRLLGEEDEDIVRINALAHRIRGLYADGGRHEAAQVFVDFWSGDGSFAALAPQAQESIARRVEKLPFDFHAAMQWPLNPQDLRAIAAPALLMAGKRSPAITRRISSALTHLLPNSRLRWFDAGHMGAVTHAARIKPWVEAFVDICGEPDVPFAPRVFLSPALSSSAAE